MSRNINLNDKLNFTYILEFLDSDFTLHVYLSQLASKIQLTGPCMHGLVLVVIIVSQHFR
jgi:hypothetical protein